MYKHSAAAIPPPDTHYLPTTLRVRYLIRRQCPLPLPTRPKGATQKQAFIIIHPTPSSPFPLPRRLDAPPPPPRGPARMVTPGQYPAFPPARGLGILGFVSKKFPHLLINTTPYLMDRYNTHNEAFTAIPPRPPGTDTLMINLDGARHIAQSPDIAAHGSHRGTPAARSPTAPSHVPIHRPSMTFPKSLPTANDLLSPFRHHSPT
ncbi:hypothetical protein CTAM01_13532 [Colletotrichum tamarilloi]|uniref:Uncharacterized protein n=1 Tax=Colletotrichum tamarilloi TaxID=1209934 RepID=A0ABQ9QRS1_9PEZI|nr:uncharacterized protein CTAM01_13532 [Colletotrichum tamarilloi]KAK1482734.1 hypothetical protein CTAM01_13532 [Colletotrichum tamarilloi]